MNQANKGFTGRRHTEETRRKMSEAAKRNSEQERERRREHRNNAAEGCRLLIAAIIRQAIKDGALWFLESELGQRYCEHIDTDPETLKSISQLQMRRKTA